MTNQEHTDEELETRQALVQGAIQSYLEDREGFSMRRAAQAAGVEPAVAYRLFNGKTALLKYYYALCVWRYEAMIAQIDGFERFELADKLSNLVYTLFDLLQEEREFVDETFEPLIYRSPSKTLFQRRLETLGAGFLEGATPLPAVGQVLPPLLAGQYLRLVRHWLHDESEGAEQTLALADRAIAFGAEALSSRLWTTGAELAKYLVGQAAQGRGLGGLTALWREGRR